MTTLDWGARSVAAAVGFEPAVDVLELGGGDLSRSSALARRFPKKHFVGSDYRLADEAAGGDGRPANLDAVALDARTVDLPPASIDFVFSIALMEHVAELDACLAAVHRVLRPGGVYFYVQAPFWTCAQGHHFRHDDDRTYEFIPKYSHLTHDADGMSALLREGPTTPPFDVDACVSSIYGRPDLSRLGLDATRVAVASGPLELTSWQEKPDRRYDEAAARDAYPHLRQPARFGELAVSGATVCLRKASAAGGGSWWRSARAALSARTARR